MPRSLFYCCLIAVCLFLPQANAIEHKRIALSFDDAPRGAGPMFSGTQRGVSLIRSLSEAQSGPVVFFIKTENLQEPGNFDRINSYAAAGHLIANHTHQHPWLSRVDADDYIRGIDQAERLLQSFKNRRPWFRFPYLDEGSTAEKRDQLRAALKARGLMNGYVTIDNYDWYLEQKWQEAVRNQMDVDMDQLRSAYLKVLMDSVGFYDELAAQTLQRSPAHVLLLHENDLAALFVDDLVAALRTDGWEIISPDEAYRDPIASITTQTLMNGQGRVAAIAIDAGVDNRTLTHLGIEESQIDQLLEDYGVFTDIEDVYIPNPH